MAKKSRVNYVCTECGSDDVLVDAYAQWNKDKQEFELHHTFDKGHWCQSCEGERSVKTVPVETSLTAYEIDVLNGIAYHEMCSANGAKPINIGETGTWCWADAFSDTLTTAQVKGVLSSLCQKQMIVIMDNGPGEDNQVNFTNAGFAAWQAHDDNRRD